MYLFIVSLWANQDLRCTCVKWGCFALLYCGSGWRCREIECQTNPGCIQIFLPASPEVSFNTTGLLKILKGRVILPLTSIDSVCRKSCLGTSESVSPPFQQRSFYFPHTHSQPPPKSNDLRHVVKTETLFGLKSHFWRCAIADPPKWILKTRLQLFFTSTYLYQLPAYLCARRWGLSSRTISWDTASLYLLQGIHVHFRVLTLEKTLTLLIDAVSFIILHDLQSSFGRRLQKEAASEEVSEWQISRWGPFLQSNEPQSLFLRSGLTLEISSCQYACSSCPQTIPLNQHK